VRIFFLHSGNETFVKLDRDLLRKFAVVQDFYAARKFPNGFLSYLQGVKKSDIVFCWFSSWNAFWALLIAKILHKPSLLVIGGYDLANLPEANYGHQRGGIGQWISRSAMNLATQLVTNSYYSQKEAEQNAGISSQSVKVIYHGVPDSFRELAQIKKERLVLTVGKVDFPNLKRKGLQIFVEAAAFFPNMQFVLIGEWADNAIDHLRGMASSNVLFTGRVTDSELLGYYCEAAVYVQASLHEGFGLSVAEAMLAGCIPVVTKTGSLPEVVGDCGLYCEASSAALLAESIRSAMRFSSSAQMQARNRILTKFPIEKRQVMLQQLIHEIA